LTCLGLCEGVICIVGSIRFPCTWLGLYGPKVHGVWALAKGTSKGAWRMPSKGAWRMPLFGNGCVYVCVRVGMCVREREREKEREREPQYTKTHRRTLTHTKTHIWTHIYIQPNPLSHKHSRIHAVPQTHTCDRRGLGSRLPQS